VSLPAGRLFLITALLLSACGATPSASHSPHASSSPAASASSLPTPASPSATAQPSGPATLVHCAAQVPAGDNLVIGSVVGDPTVVVRDIQDPANARNLCTFDQSTLAPQFVSATAVAYGTPAGQIVRADLASGATTVLATYGAGIGSGQYSVSPDGRSITYIDGNSWHLAGPSGNRVLTTLPGIPARGINPDEDDSFLSYSPDGLYIALFQTFHTGGSGETAPDQVRRASDGSLVYSTSGMTMAVWASVPSRLFFRDGAGNVHRWDPSSGASSMVSLHWIRPRQSPDGRWIAYIVRASNGLGQFGLYSVQGNQAQTTPLNGRTGVVFLSNDLVFYNGERACSNCIGPQLTGVSYIYDIAGGTEVTSRLSAAYDAWPHSTPPGL
jgi:WD40 repeat protein